MKKKLTKEQLELIEKAKKSCSKIGPHYKLSKKQADRLMELYVPSVEALAEEYLIGDKMSKLGIKIVKPHVKLVTPEEWFEKIPWLIEYCGRLSHKSEDRMQEGSADPFIRKVAGRLGHESITEHMVITYHVYCDRSCSHQLVRHRIAAYTQESQRYCNYAKGDTQLMDVILPPSIGYLDRGEIIFLNNHLGEMPFVLRMWVSSTLNSYKNYLLLIEQGIPPEDARSVLPNDTKTELAVTFNLRMWRHVFKMRALNKHAQWQIRDIFTDILNDLGKRLPMFFDDLLEK